MQEQQLKSGETTSAFKQPQSNNLAQQRVRAHPVQPEKEKLDSDVDVSVADTADTEATVDNAQMTPHDAQELVDKLDLELYAAKLQT
jgi:hypothetical protein